MEENEREFEKRRARDEVRQAMQPSTPKIGDIHLTLAELHMGRCARLGERTDECADCVLANICRLERSEAALLHDMPTPRLVHLSRTMSEEMAGEAWGREVAAELHARGVLPGFSDLTMSRARNPRPAVAAVTGTQQAAAQPMYAQA